MIRRGLGRPCQRVPRGLSGLIPSFHMGGRRLVWSRTLAPRANDPGSNPGDRIPQSGLTLNVALTAFLCAAIILVGFVVVSHVFLAAVTSYSMLPTLT